MKHADILTFRPTHTRPRSPYLVVVVGKVGAGIIAGDYQTEQAAQIGRGLLKHETPDLEFAIVKQKAA